ncbi:MAG: HD domain-containing protein [Ktedonobacterales bacterium]|nr:HD domain-containing protein [Ktedonobacterales bacterium]
MRDLISDLAARFTAAGHQLYLVGGTVRDALLGRDATPDIDMTTDATPDAIQRLVAATHPRAVVLVGERFGTVRLHYATAPAPSGETPATATLSAEAEEMTVAPDLIVEITTFRSERYDPASRKPEVIFGDRLEDDLLRRDFTINALAQAPQSGEIIDCFGGQADLAAGLIRAVGDDPDHRFAEDPLRMLRAVRFAAQLGFTIEERTEAAIRDQAATLEKISKERIRDEFNKILVSPRPMLGLRVTVNLGLMPYIVPEALELRGVSQQPMPGHTKDVYEHVLRVVQNTPPRLSMRWAGLLHDIAKPRTRAIENGQVHFFGHEDLGAVMAREILKRLHFDRPFIDHISRLVKLHMRSNAYLSDWTDGAVRRLMLDAGDTLPDLLDLSRADITSYRPDKVSRAVARVNELEERSRFLAEEALRVPIKSPLDGNELMALFGRGPGVWLKPIKEHLLALVIDGQLAPDDKVTAEAIARGLLNEQA